MKRLAVTLFAFVLLVAPLVAEVQPRQLPQIGFVAPGSAAASNAFVEAFRQGLRERGYVEGKTIVIEWRFAEGRMEQLAKFAADLGAAKVAVVVTPDTLAAKSLQIATPTVPVILAGADLRWGLISNLAHPGGNVSGLSSMAGELEYGFAVWLAFHLFVLLYEEPTLRSTFGAGYEAFCANVPRWMPRLRPWKGN